MRIAKDTGDMQIHVEITIARTHAHTHDYTYILLNAFNRHFSGSGISEPTDRFSTGKPKGVRKYAMGQERADWLANLYLKICFQIYFQGSKIYALSHAVRAQSEGTRRAGMKVGTYPAVF